MPLEDVRLVVCDTGSARQLTASAYNLRREECRAAVACLAGDDPAIQSLRDVTPEAVEAAVRSGRLEPVLARRARHIVSENRRVLATGAALEAGDVDAVGEIFAASHRSLRDDFEVSSSALDAMVDVAIATPGVLAARMTGAGFGGCTVNLVRPDAVAALRRTVDSEYVRRTGLRPRVFAVEPADGAGFVG
jgi:galactokinase